MSEEVKRFYMLANPVLRKSIDNVVEACKNVGLTVYQTNEILEGMIKPIKLKNDDLLIPEILELMDHK